ncbi:MAG: YpdA family putative bacillithiol disulfide reductase [Bacteroidetes bacterium]|nr:MAG: YpdA family putative bacillithiol disulfide reductase [Bacteroidota bacterium]
MFDIIIVGAGPIGMTVGIEAKKKGLSCLIIEKGMLVNTVYRFPTNMTFFSTSKLLEIGEVPFISHQDKPTRREALEYFRRVQEAWQLDIRYYECVEDVTGEPGDFKITTDASTYAARHVVIATGFYDYPHLMHVPGEDLPKVKHFYDEPHPYVGQKVAVIGAANSGCDVALELYHKGAGVTMIVREGEIGRRVKYWIKPNIENRIKEGSITAHFNSTVQEIGEKTITFNTPDGQKTIENDFVLAMTGYEPDFSFLKKIGIEKEETGLQMLIYNDDTHLSTVPGIYLAGVVCGGMKTNKFFIENAKDHAEKIVGDIIGNAKNASV